jgi:hypothetical protein
MEFCGISMAIVPEALFSLFTAMYPSAVMV